MNEEEDEAPITFCFCVGRMISLENCDGRGCLRNRQIHSLARAWRPQGPPVEQPPGRD